VQGLQLSVGILIKQEIEVEQHPSDLECGLSLKVFFPCQCCQGLLQKRPIHAKQTYF